MSSSRIAGAWRSFGSLAVSGFLVASPAAAAAGIGDCNVNGIPDAAEIAAGLVDDCNGNGVPDPCDYAGVSFEGESSPFGGDNSLVLSIARATYSVSDMRLTIEVRADLDAAQEFVTVKVGDSVVGTLWINGGEPCPVELQVQTVIVPMATVNASIDASNGSLLVSLEASGVVSVKECPDSFAAIVAEYVGDLLPPDCLGNGSWDICDLAADPSLDCNGNGLIDLCDVQVDPSLDCDGNGKIDSCEIASDASLDCNANSVLDACELAENSDIDCDGNGAIDSCEIGSDPSLDCNANSVIDACDLAVDPGVDCDKNGELDSCEIAADPSLDCAGFGILNKCMLALRETYFDYDCDNNGELDACQIVAEPPLDKNGDGLLDACQYGRGDFTLDQSIDGADLSVLLSLWGTTDPPFGDLTGDGDIDGADLASLLGNWGTYQTPWGVVLEFAPNPTVVTDDGLRAGILSTGLPWRVRDLASGAEMLLVPPGTFMMGCSPSLLYGCSNPENPVHEVTLTRAFYLGRYEVTQAQWTAVMGSNPSVFQSPGSEVPLAQVPKRPVEHVSWNMIQEFEGETGLRLPTEAEWEYACRAGTTTAFNNGSDDDAVLGTLAWFAANSGTQTRPVGQKLANALGLHDMHGNVGEFVEDWFQSSYYAQSPATDPQGPVISGLRGVRGGGLNSVSNLCRTSRRGFRGPDVVGNGDVGFRVARTP